MATIHWMLACSLLVVVFCIDEVGEHSGRHGTRPRGTPYSPGILAGDTLYVSGLQGTDPKTHALPDDFGQEARNCLENIGHVLNDAHMNYSDVVSVQIYLDDISQFQEVNAIYKEYFKNPLPSRTTVQVAKLSLGAHIEISAIARK